MTARHPAVGATPAISPLVAGQAFRAVSRRAALAAYFAVFLAFFDNFALLPLIGPRALELGADALGVGLIVAGYSLANLVLNLVGGSLTDRIGRRTVVLLSLAVAPACIAIYGLASDLSILFAARVIHGVFGGLLMAGLFAMLADVAPQGQRGRTIGRAGALIGLAAVIGPALAGLAATRFGPGPVFIGVAIVLAVGLLVIWRMVPETLPEAERVERAPGTWRRLLGDPRLRVAFVAIFGLEAAVGIVTGFVKDGIIERQLAAGMELERAIRYASGAQGGLFSVFALVAVLAMLSPIARRVDRKGPIGISIVGLLILAGSTAILAMSPTLETDLVAMLLYGLGFGLLFPAAAAGVGIAARASERGRAYGVFNLSFDAGLVVGPLVAGWIAVSAFAISPFATATVGLLVVAVLIPLVARGARIPEDVPAQ